MSRVVSIRLKDEQLERLKRFARRLGKSQSEMGALLIEEGMREAEFGQIEFRDSAAGRQAYLKGSTLAVWEVILVARDHGMDLEQVARYLQRPTEWVRAAFHYHEAFPAEIDQAIDDNRLLGYEKLKRLLPQLELIEVPREAMSDAQQP
jgi:DNA-binding transcriptional MerR regulator